MPIWAYEYYETGGYDCMTGAFIIRKNGQDVALVDQRDFGQEPCDYRLLERAEEVALFIVHACNKMELEA